MTEVITHSYKHGSITSGNNPSNDLETKCGDIFLLANTNFWFACGFCQDRFINVFTFINHIKDEHIPDVKIEPLQDAPTTTRVDVENDDDDEKSSIDLDAGAHSQSSVDNESVGDEKDNESVKDEKDNKSFEDEKKNIKNDEPEIKLDSIPEVGISKDEESCKQIEEVLTEEIRVTRRRGRKKVLYEPLISISSTDKDVTAKSDKNNDEGTPNEGSETKSEDKNSSPVADKKSKKKYYRKKNVFPCPICKESITDGRSLKKHIRSHNEGGNENRFQCEECGKCYKNSFNLKTHSIIHSGTRPFKCEFCDVGFSHPNSLKTHRFLHTGDRPYKCDQCDKSFVSNSSRKVHMRQHTGETPYVCQYCGKGYTIKSNFDIHVRRHTGQRNFQCNQCNKGFFNKETLVNHIACHTGEKNFVCDVCSNRFSRRKDLVEHRKLHLDHKYYSCKVCGKEFSQYSGLYSHMRQHKNKDKDKEQ